jgi:signal transduction histidine kinase
MGAVPLFILLLFLVRWSMGESPIPQRPMLLVGGALYLSAFYALTPWAWQWTGDERHRTGLVRGWIQALVWNLAWLGLMALVHTFHRGPEPQHLAQGLAYIAKEAALPLPAVRLIVQMPFAILVGWFVAEKEASDLDLKDAEAARQRLEVQNRESRIQALLAQLDPHVLYNALGALSELVREDPRKAEEALLDFSDFYRRLTRLREVEWIRLEEERALLEQYLAMEGLRLGSRLEVVWEWPEALQELRIPPLLVLPLVENALKHGIAPCASGGRLGIRLQRLDEGLEVAVLNTGQPLGAPDPKGTGLRNLKARLELLGRGASTLALMTTSEGTCARLNLASDQVREAP